MAGRTKEEKQMTTKPKTIIDCDKDPFCPKDWIVEEHKKGGKLEWNPKNISLYLSENQKKDWIKGNELREELKGKPVLNANVLDYLLAHPELIPEEWKGKYVFFWGTIYRDSDGSLNVRYLGWNGERWNWSFNWLDNVWYDVCPAAVSAGELEGLDSLILRIEKIEQWIDQWENYESGWSKYRKNGQK